MNLLLRVTCLTRITTGWLPFLIRRTVHTCATPVSKYSTAPRRGEPVPMSFYTLFSMRQEQAMDENERFPYLTTSLFFNSPLEGQSSVDGSPQPRWGWPVYRTAYGHDDVDKQFARFTQLLFSTLKKSIDSPDCTELELEQLMDFPVFEGAHLDALSSAGVRLEFEKWAMKRGVPRYEPQPGDPELPWINGIPANFQSYAGARFNHCLMVDRRSLDSLDSEEPFIGVVQKNWLPEWHPTYLKRKTSFVIHERYDIIEGNPSGDVGWWYMPMYLLVGEYDCMSQKGYQLNYDSPRPPMVFDSKFWYTEKWRGDEEEGHSKGIEPCTMPYTYKEWV